MKTLPEDKVSTELWNLMRAIPYTFKPRDLRNWVTTPRILGSIPGVFYNVTLVATDHNRALYLDGSGRPLLGHIQQFDGKKKLYKSMSKVSPNKNKKLKTKKPKTYTPNQMKNYLKIKAELLRDSL